MLYSNFFNASRAASILFVFAIFTFNQSSIAQNNAVWTTNFDSAKVKSMQEDKFILLNFSGSDWCGPCIKMRKDILSSEPFLKYAADHLILLNADFPRMKKNQQDKQLVQQNEKLADTYNKQGKFPYTLLLSKDLKILKIWDGCPQLTQQDEYSNIQEQFTGQIKETISAIH